MRGDHYPFRGDPLPSARSMLSINRHRLRVAATLRHRAYSYGFSAALRMWMEMPYRECWGMTREGDLPRRARRKRQKRPNLAIERMQAAWIPF